MPSKKSTKVLPACLDPHLAGSLGLFSSPPPARSRRGRRRGVPQRDESHIQGRSYWHRASGRGASSSRPRRSRKAPIRRHLRGRSWRRRGNHAGRWGRSSPEQTARTAGPPSAWPHHERRSGSVSGTPKGRPGSSSSASGPAPRRAATPGVARCPRVRLRVGSRANHWSPFVGVVGPAPAPRARPRAQPGQQRAKPSLNCAVSGKSRAKKKPGRLGHPGFSSRNFGDVEELRASSPRR